MAQATETFAVGADQFTAVVEIDLSTVWLISGDFSGTIPSGQVGFINGDVNLTGDLIVEGLLTGIDTFTLEGNGHQILTQHGGQLNLQGVEKSGWEWWGDPPVNWQTGDRLRVSGTAPGIFVPYVSTWGGTWGTTTRPPNSPDVVLPPNPYQTVAKPEVVNLERSITLKNLSRIHFHDGAGVQTLKWLAIVNSGITGQLAQYPIHFHHCGESVRGSLVEGVVIDLGRNHAFVPHDSHGITFRDCVAYNTFDDPFWWDLPAFPGDTTNNSNDIVYDHCLAMYVRPSITANQYRVTGFLLGAGAGNGVIDSVACNVQGTTNASGFHWPEQVNGNPGGTLWLFERNVFHNNKIDGIFVWQNDFSRHRPVDFIGYRNGLSQIDHGAYGNTYDYVRGVLMGGGEAAFKLHAEGNILLEDIFSDRTLRMMKHRLSPSTWVIVRRCKFSLFYYSETGDSGILPSKIRYEDCGLIPADFSMVGAIPSSIAEIYETGVLTHRWTQGVWT